MKDKQTETRLRMIALQLESWKKLHDLITYGLDKAKPIISADQERQFTEVRANLLQEAEHVLRELNLIGELSGRAMNVLNRGSSLRVVRELSNDDARRLEDDRRPRDLPAARAGRVLRLPGAVPSPRHHAARPARRPVPGGRTPRSRPG